LRAVMKLKKTRSFLCGREGVGSHNERMIAKSEALFTAEDAESAKKTYR
jgi:hypothetical protein